MKLFTKILLCTIAVISIALSLTGYLIISSSFRYGISSEKQRGQEEYSILKYYLISGILSATETGTFDSDKLGELAQEACAIAPTGSHTAVFASDGEILSSTFPQDYSFQILSQTDETALLQINEVVDHQYWLITIGKFSQNDETLYLAQSRDISSVIEERHRQERQYFIIYASVFGVSVIVTAILSYILTAPIKRLARSTRRFSKGKYHERIPVSSTDEIGELSRSFNTMAETIEGTIHQLELAAQQREDFVANFAHELKTPLTSVIGYADMLYQRNDLSRGEIKEAAGYIVNEGMRLEALSLKLMELIVLDKHDFVFIEMQAQEVFKDLADTLMPIMAEKGIAFTDRISPAYIRIEFDLFKTMLLNLVDNAVKADSSRIEITGEQKDAGTYRIMISDNGRGIPGEKLSRITEAFYVVDKSRSRRQHGAGLGLSIVSRIAELHGARLVFESALGAGTSITVDLQISEVPQ